jgi:hypothetical protein
MTSRIRLISAIALSGMTLALAGCKTKGDIVLDESVGISSVRSACPAVGIPDYTGDMTLFTTPGATDAASIDLTAAMTNVRTTCNDQAAKVYTEAEFDVLARRTNSAQARTVQLPYFVTVLRGGTSVVTKRVGTVTLTFAAGQDRAQAHGKAGAFVDKAEATLPSDVRDRIMRKRRAAR